MNKNNRVGESEVLDAIALSVAAESHRIDELNSNQIAKVNGAAMPKVATISSIAASVMPDLEDIATAGMFPKMEFPDFN